MSAEKLSYTYYQYFSDQNIPVFCRANLQNFHAELPNSLKELGFTESTVEAWERAQVEHGFLAKCLDFDLPTAQVAQHIGSYRAEDKFGKEHLSPKGEYKIYRYQGQALAHFLPHEALWKLFVVSDFGRQEQRQVIRIVLTRLLSWALLPLDIIGFWGVPIQEGLVILKQRESLGEAIFFDVRRNHLLTLDGVSSLAGAFKILRLDSTLKGKGRKMGVEELYSFLSHHATFFDFQGHPKKLKAALTYFVQCAEGEIWPRDNFVPRNNLEA